MFLLHAVKTNLCWGIFFLRFGGTVPAQSTFISKILYVKMIGIVMYMFSATTFFFLSSVQVSLRRLLRIRIWKGRVMGLGFGVRVFQVYCRVWLGLFWFLVVFRFSLMGLDWPQFFEILTQRGWLFICILKHRDIIWKRLLVEANCSHSM